MITKKDFINGIYEDNYVRFYIGNHKIIKLPQSSLFLVMSFKSPIDMKVINQEYNNFINK